MLQATWHKYTLRFKFEARTSRNSMLEKDTWFIRMCDTATSSVGVGECAMFRGLSREDSPEFEDILTDACRHPKIMPEISSIRFAFESALAAMKPIPDNAFTRGEVGIPINGLIWMGDKATMKARIAEKLDAGFKVLKLKIGGINFEDELDLLAMIRKQFDAGTLELRLDANGSFLPANAIERLKRLSNYGIHSIEQPIRPGQWDAMARICRTSPIDIALDEELIGWHTEQQMSDMLDAISPQYIILKPSLCGGFSAADSWIKHAENRGIGWWATSALESNIGLTAIALWLSSRCENVPTMPQGLGTGQLFHNNLPSPLKLHGDKLYYENGCC